MLDRENSDNRAKLLTTNKIEGVPKPFKVFDCWIDNISLRCTLEETWENLESNSLHVKYKRLRNVIKTWNQQSNGNVHSNIEALEIDQFKADEEGDSDQVRKAIYLRLNKLYNMRSEMLKQKSRLRRQIGGDKNLKYSYNLVKY